MANSTRALLSKTRALYSAIYRFDVWAAGELGVHISDLRCINELENGPLSAGEIGDRLGLTSGSVTALINRLVDKGCAIRHQSETDKRSVEIALDAKFYREAGAVFSRLGHKISAHFDGMEAQEIESVANHLETFANSFDEACQCEE